MAFPLTTQSYHGKIEKSFDNSYCPNFLKKFHKKATGVVKTGSFSRLNKTNYTRYFYTLTEKLSYKCTDNFLLIYMHILAYTYINFETQLPFKNCIINIKLIYKITLHPAFSITILYFYIIVTFTNYT